MPPVSQPADLLAALARVSDTIRAAQERAASQCGVSPVMARLLNELGDGAPTLNELAAGLALDKSSASGLVDRAQRRGLVRRVPSQRDRRSVRVRLTAPGRELAGQIWELHTAALTALLEPLTAAERDALQRSAVALLAGGSDPP